MKRPPKRAAAPMVDPNKVAVKLDPGDLMQFENLRMKLQLATIALQGFLQEMANKYSEPGKPVQLAADGAIVR